MLRDKLLDYLIDCSTADDFCFSLRCEVCKTEWRSRTIRFSHAAGAEKNQQKRVIYDALYQREWRMARQSALEQAIDHFGICPVCHRLVCDCCFLICEEIEICQSCAKALRMTGEPIIAKSE